MRLENMENHHSQPGDPDKAGEVITRLVNYEKMPERFVLENRLEELKEWEALSRQSDF